MRIASIPYLDMDVYDGMLTLLKANPEALLLLPITEYTQFTESVHRALKDAGNPYTIFAKEITDDIKELADGAADKYITKTPVEDILGEVNHGDILAVIDDGSDKFAEALETMEGYGLTTYNMADGGKLMSEFHTHDDVDGIEDVLDALEVFLESMVKYVAKQSLLAMRESIIGSIEKMSEFMDKRDDEDWDDLED